MKTFFPYEKISFLFLARQAKKMLNHRMILPIVFFSALILRLLFPSVCQKISNFSGIYNLFCTFLLVPLLFAKCLVSIQVLLLKADVLKLPRLFIFLIVLVFLFLLGIAMPKIFNFCTWVTEPKPIQELVIQELRIPKVSLDDPLNTIRVERLENLLMKNLPSNFFASLASGHMVQIILSAIFLGVSISYSKPQIRKSINKSLGMLQNALEGLGKGVFLFLPVGLFLDLCASFSMMTNVTALFSVWKYIFVIIFIFSIICIISFMVMAVISHKNLRSFFRIHQEVFALVFLSHEFLLAANLMMNTNKKNPYIKNQVAAFIFPASLSFFQFGNVIYLASVYSLVGDIYGISWGPMAYAMGFMLVVLNVLPDDQIEKTIPLIFAPLGLPCSFAITFFPVLDWIVQPFRALCTFSVNGACTFWVAHSRRKQKNDPKEAIPEEIRVYDLMAP